jgi:aryl-alcohol dehydrogenase-like predicted oxidoreductase
MALLCWASLVVRLVPFRRWSKSLGRIGPVAPSAPAEARRAAGAVERAAWRLPFRAKCLPQAMALSWLLRRRGIGHAVVIAVRPAQLRDSPDALHAWLEVDGEKIIGDLPGPWLETLRLGG